jgi:hypothetical protein
MALIVLILVFGIFAVVLNNKENNSKESSLREYICSSDVYNCEDFSSQEEAQQVYNLCLELNGEEKKDIHRLDSNGDGIVCENLPKE